MTVRRKLLLTSLIVSLPVGYAMYAAVQAVRDRETLAALDRVVISQITEGNRAQCEDYAQWFLAGPRESKPTLAERQQPDADVLVKRPSASALPLEFFAYDREFTPKSTAGPRFPREFQNVFRGQPDTTMVAGRFDAADGKGFQIARATGWGDPCAILLFRQHADPHHTRTSILLFSGLMAGVFLAALIVAAPIERRIRMIARASRESSKTDYSVMTPVGGRDELSAIAFDFNEAAANIGRRVVDVKDRDEALRRLIAHTGEVVAQPALTADDLRARIGNLAAAAKLRITIDTSARQPIDLTTLVQRVVDRFQPFATHAGITLTTQVPPTPVSIAADTILIEQMIANLVDNAIRHSHQGGHADVTLEPRGTDGFSLRVSDDGSNLPDDVFVRLNAIRRFRGDEGRTQQPGDLGLGLAIVREVGDRFGIQWSFRRRPSGGFEAELYRP